MTTPALYATIWVALALFVAGEFGKKGSGVISSGNYARPQFLPCIGTA